jgi:hypothetical protein
LIEEVVLIENETSNEIVVEEETKLQLQNLKRRKKLKLR